MKNKELISIIALIVSIIAFLISCLKFIVTFPVFFINDLPNNMYILEMLVRISNFNSIFAVLAIVLGILSIKSKKRKFSIAAIIIAVISNFIYFFIGLLALSLMGFVTMM